MPWRSDVNVSVNGGVDTDADGDGAATDAVGVGDGVGVGAGVGVGVAPTPPSRGMTLRPTTAIATTAARREQDLGEGVHLGQPPRRPPGTALWGRGDLIEHRVQDTVREGGDAVVQPRPDDARDVAFGTHRVASRAVGRESASRAARNPRIA